MFFVYRQTESELWTVGHYAYQRWISESDHASPGEASDRARYLNGGSVESKADLVKIVILVKPEDAKILISNLGIEIAGASAQMSVKRPGEPLEVVDNYL